ncbi:iron-containing alcohol dehydrogenase [Aquamicrobium zhengzhouense]|uniref:Iron-containing alcohol dehydrogenase n=1 Tax=Aquamicrobium zhengzhouense TaxID=2781738 RepID=A0ABS0SD76_9HYPH|nr:iron-containing alcohol dehydrogenase [Aquamicrobium zhengzhouense]MBI1621254.1 iron-containing alcohol dehydrogenase [Aquamicrobium zhengzhouense]
MADTSLTLARAITVVQPPRLEIGAGSISRLGEWAAAYKRVFVIAMGPTVDFVERLNLKSELTIYSDLPPEPDLPSFDLALDAARSFKPDLVVGLGGGSVMDVAKLIAALWDKDLALPDVVGAGKIPGRQTALAQIPTTAGTGSEAGIRALVTDPQTLAKMAVESTHMLADIAILDPELTYSVPGPVTAATGVDAMAHCVEAFTNIKAHPLIDGYARQGIELVGRYLARAVADGTDTEARAGMMLASYYGGICLGPVNTAGGHALSYPLGTRLKLPHGLANAIIFPHVLAYNAQARPEKTQEIATWLGFDNSSPEALLASSVNYCRQLGVEMSLEKHGAKAEELGLWAEEAFAIKRLIDNNPRAFTLEDVEAIYRAAF